MGKLANRAWWSSIRAVASEPEADTDYADMGTAFGLDASLSPADGEAAVADEQRALPEERRRRD